MAEQIRFWLTPVPEAEADPFLGPQMAYDLAVLQPEATVGDYLAGLEDFQAATLADCKGCDGCCHERAPLTIADWQLSGHSGEPAGGLAVGLGGAKLLRPGGGSHAAPQRKRFLPIFGRKAKMLHHPPLAQLHLPFSLLPTQNGAGGSPARGSHQRR